MKRTPIVVPCGYEKVIKLFVDHTLTRKNLLVKTRTLCRERRFSFSLYSEVTDNFNKNFVEKVS